MASRASVATLAIFASRGGCKNATTVIQQFADLWKEVADD